MASRNQNRWSLSSAGDQVSAVQETYSLRYSSDCVVYLLFGRDERNTQSNSNIWIKMTRSDLENPDVFRRALTHYLQDATDLGITHYYPFFGDILMRANPSDSPKNPKQDLVLIHTPVSPSLGLLTEASGGDVSSSAQSP